MPPDFSALYAVHDAARRDLVRLTEVVGGTAPVRGAHVDGLRSHWELLSGVLAAHERAEDSLLWPALAMEVRDDDRTAVETALGQHPELSAALAGVGDAFAAPEPFGTTAARAGVAVAVHRASVLADHHFALEEGRLLPLLRASAGTAAWDAFVTAWIDDPGPGGRADVLPFVLDGAHPKRAAAVLALLGADEQAEYAQAWRPAYRERVAGLW